MQSAKKTIKNLILILLSTFLATSSSAKDFELDVLPQAEHPNFILPEMIGQTYYDVVHNHIAEAMEKEGAIRTGSNERKLKSGGGVSVYLAPNIYNIHINFPKSEMGGRSYGWTSGKVGDWSDSMYLNSIADVTKQESEKEIADLYKVLVNILGTSDSSGLSKLQPDTVRVATNYLAIHTAEQYRRIQKKTTRWDDALLQVTLLAAFHSGQEKFQMFYTGDFTDIVRKKNPGVYANGREGVLFDKAKKEAADLESYHQFSSKTPDLPGANRSGINVTRKDFERMGEHITQYFEENGSEYMDKIKKIVGYKEKDKNIIAAIAKYYCEGFAKPEDTKAMAEAVSGFMIETRTHANIASKVIAENVRQDYRSTATAACLRFYAH
ncbi:MAG: hypothetical protein B7Y39_10405 [Bdellovibrio sp. 28-41-41]|nr:MAG: hypothetical protein B7Y39_10405 [Bdellovibrio sp. 28-41-41]